MLHIVCTSGACTTHTWTIILINNCKSEQFYNTYYNKTRHSLLYNSIKRWNVLAPIQVQLLTLWVLIKEMDEESVFMFSMEILCGTFFSTPARAFTIFYQLILNNNQKQREMLSCSEYFLKLFYFLCLKCWTLSLYASL